MGIGKSVIAHSTECGSLGPNPPNPISLCAPTGVRRCNRVKKGGERVIFEYPFLWAFGTADAGINRCVAGEKSPALQVCPPPKWAGLLGMKSRP